MSGYDQWSSFYDTYPNPTVMTDENFFPPHWSHLKNKRILEVGCGTGRHTEKLLRLGNKVVGIDSSPGMLEVARKKLLPHPDLDLIDADFLEHNFTSESFDGIVSSLVLEHVSDLNSFFKKMVSLLKRGGDIFLSEIHPSRAAVGALAHFKNPEKPDEEIWLKSYVHRRENFLAAIESARLTLVKEEDALGDCRLAEVKASWVKFVDKPMIKIWILRRLT